MRCAGLITALAIAVWPQFAAAQSEPLTNIEIRMVKTSKRPPLRITADTRNPNDFAVHNVELECTIKDKAGRSLVTYNSTIFSMLPPNHRQVTRGLNIGAWPPQGYAGFCVSKRAQRVANPAAPAAPVQDPQPQSQLPTAPAPAAPQAQPANAGR